MRLRMCVGLFRVRLGGVQQLARRSITCKALRVEDPDKKPPPWPYREKSYHKHHWLTDWTTKRLDENSKLIVVEGNIGSGKSHVAMELAEQLDFHYMPEFTMDDILINGYGIDRREYYHYIPPSCAIPDINMFYENPENPYNACMQEMMYFGKFELYLNAIAHILNTGQGVVMERSPFSDFVFVNAMRQKGIASHEYFRHYHYKRKVTIPSLHFWPHLVIYLDTPVNVCLERIRRRGIPHENNGKVIDAEYLDAIRESYKDLLKEYSKHSKMLVYDWERMADSEQLTEDVEKVELDWFEWHGGDVLKEWNQVPGELDWNSWRRMMTTKSCILTSFEMIDCFEVEELLTPQNDLDQFYAVMKKFVMGPYSFGHNPQRDGITWNSITCTDVLNRNLEPSRWFDYFYRDEWWLHSAISKLHPFDKYGDDMFQEDYNQQHH